jgi:hypothetical protein
MRSAPAAFADFRTGDDGKTPGEILAHMGDLMDWALSIAKSKQEWHNSPVLPWDKECARFFDALKAFDDYLASGQPLGCTPEKLFQGPVADALTHTGQLAMLRRMSGSRMKGENYFQAEIIEGRVGTDQAAPSREF